MILYFEVGVFAENLVGLGFLSSVSYIKPIPTHENLFAVGKKWPRCHFYHLFFGIEVALGRGVRRFHGNIYMFPNPT